MIRPPRQHDVAYEAFYGLAEPPFSLSPDPRFLYPSAAHDAAIRHLLSGIQRNAGWTMLTGEPGAGKTTTCHAVVDRLDRTIPRALVLDPFLSMDDLLRQVLSDFGATSSRAARAQASTLALTAELHDFLRRRPSGSGAVVILDEAQLVSPAVLDELDTVVGTLPLHVVLVGQPGLIDALRSPTHRRLAERITQRATLGPMERGDTAPYIAHRLTVAGESLSVVFDRAASARVHALAGGVPRAINLLCDAALALGASRGAHEITGDIVEQAAGTVTVGRQAASPGRHRRRQWVVLAGVAAVVALAFLLLMLT